MDARKMGSALGVGLMVIAVLSMIAMPALASAKERATTSHNYRFYCCCGKSSGYVWVEGYCTNPGPFIGGNRGYSISGGTFISFNYMSDPNIEWAQLKYKCNYCGCICEITVWVSPPTIANPWGGQSARCYKPV